MAWGKRWEKKPQQILQPKVLPVEIRNSAVSDSVNSETRLGAV
jgi:hypothetical protein